MPWLFLAKATFLTCETSQTLHQWLPTSPCAHHKSDLLPSTQICHLWGRFPEIRGRRVPFHSTNFIQAAFKPPHYGRLHTNNALLHAQVKHVVQLRRQRLSYKLQPTVFSGVSV